MIKNIITNYILPFLFFIILIFGISYKSLPTYNNVIGYNDGAYYFNIENKSSYTETVYSDDYFGSNLSSIIFLKKTKGEVTLFFKKIGLSDSIISYVLSFGLLFCCSIIYFYIFKSVSSSISFGYLAGVFVIFNNFTIESIAFGGFFYYSFGLISLAILFYLLYLISTTGSAKQIYIIGLIFAGAIISLPIHLVIFYICIIAFFLFGYFKKNINNNYLLILSLIVITGIHSYWIVPFIMNTISVSSDEVYGGNASGVLNGYKSIANYINIISFRQYFNLISFQLFSSPLVSVYYLLITGGLFYISFFQKNIKYKGFMYFLIIIYFLFFNISLGPNSALTGQLFQYLWENVSVFQFFRSFTRFIIVLIPIILLIYGIYISAYKIKGKYINYVILITIALHIPLLSGNLNGVIPRMIVPTEYISLNNYLKTYNGEKNIISYPNISYELHTWNVSTSENMKQNYYFQESFINGNIVYDRTSLQLVNKNSNLNSLFKYRFDENLIEQIKNSGIDLVLVHKDYLNIFNGKIIDYSNYKNYLDSTANTVMDNNYFTLYQVPNSLETLTLDQGDIQIEKISSVEYDLTLKLDSESDVLRFYKNFDSNWRLYDESGREILLDHRKHNETFNKWIIDGESFGGDKEVSLKLYFKMQDYYNLGINITQGFIFLIAFYIFCSFIRRKNAK